MKAQTWDFETGCRSPAVLRPRRRKTVAEILRGAYRRYVRDPDTRLAVKRTLR
jgi:hypothetical protein